MEVIADINGPDFMVSSWSNRHTELVEKTEDLRNGWHRSSSALNSSTLLCSSTALLSSAALATVDMFSLASTLAVRRPAMRDAVSCCRMESSSLACAVVRAAASVASPRAASSSRWRRST